MDNMTEMDQRDLAILQSLKDASGTVQPAAVVAAARPSSHPWHSRFEWSDKKAGEQYRLDQARQLIRRVSFKIVNEKIVTWRPAFIQQPGVQERGYIETAEIDQDEIKRAVLNDEIARIRGHVQRARGLASQFGLDEEFEFLLTELLRLQERLKLAA